jgi:hypothetical protein
MRRARPQHASVWTLLLAPGVMTLAAWLVVMGTLLVVRLGDRGTATVPRANVTQFLTYWSLMLEALILVWMLGAELVLALAQLRGHRAFSRRWATVVVLPVGIYVGTAAMVFVMSVYISVAGSAELASVWGADPTFPVANLVTHTLPMVSACFIVAHYRTQLIRVLRDARILWIVDAGHLRPRWLLLRDFLHFHGPLLMPVVYTLTHSAASTYGVEFNISARLLAAVGLLGPSIVLAWSVRVSCA